MKIPPHWWGWIGAFSLLLGSGGGTSLPPRRPVVLQVTSSATWVPMGQPVNFNIQTTAPLPATIQWTSSNTPRVHIMRLKTPFTTWITTDHNSHPQTITYTFRLRSPAAQQNPPPLTIHYTFQGNGTNHPYTTKAGWALIAVTHLRAANKVQTPDVHLTAAFSSPPVYQFWWGTPTGWHSSAFTSRSTVQWSHLPSGLISLTGYAKLPNAPDQKPWLAKSPTLIIANNQPIPSGFQITPSVVRLGQSVTVTAPAGYPTYQWWWAPQGGTSGDWTSSGPYQQHHRTISVNLTQPGAYQFIAYGQKHHHTYQLGRCYINVNAP